MATGNLDISPSSPGGFAARARRGWEGQSARRRIRIIVCTLLVLAGALVMLVPLAWMLSTSLKDEGDVFLIPVRWIPTHIRWSNYPEALTFVPYVRYFLNSVEVTGLAVLGTVVSSSLVAFAFARLRGPGKNVLFVILLSTLMLPGEVTLVPVYLFFRKLGWLDTYLPLIVPSWFGTNAFYIFLLRQFFLTLPTELDDAAKIDGASLFHIFSRILLPLSKPALASVAIFASFAHWNSFLPPLIYLNSTEKYTLPVGLRLFLSTLSNSHWNYLMAATVVAIIPPLALFFFAQRYFIEGAVLTGVKG